MSVDLNDIINSIPDPQTRQAIQNALTHEAVYLGNPDLDGCWRMKVNDTGNLVVSKKVSGSWVAKGEFTA